MQNISGRKGAFRFAAALGLTALFAGLMAQSPARAADDWRFHRNRNDAHFDVIAIHRDEDRLHDLYRRREYLRDRHDRRGVAELDVQIGNVRFHLDNDRYDLRRDSDRYDRNRFDLRVSFDRDRPYRSNEYDRDNDRAREYDRNRDRYEDRSDNRYHDGYRIRDGH